MDLPFLHAVAHLQRHHDSARKARPTREVGRQLRLQPPLHDPPQLGGIRWYAPREALVVQQLQQRGEGFLVPVVRCGRQEQPVLAVWREFTDRLGAQRIRGVPAPPGRRAGVHLVDHQQIEGARQARRALRQHVAQQPHRPVPLQPVHAHDQSGVVGERVDPHTPLPAQRPHQLGVEHPELQAELVLHLLAPLDAQARRADHEHRAGPVPQDQLLDDQPGLDRLAQPDVVGDQQVGPRHAERPYQRVELVVLNVDAAAERSLEQALVRAGQRPPSGQRQGKRPASPDRRGVDRVPARAARKIRESALRPLPARRLGAFRRSCRPRPRQGDQVLRLLCSGED